MKPSTPLFAASLLSVSHLVAAQDRPPCPPPYAVCLTEEEKRKVVDAVKELDDIKSNPAKLEFQEPIVIIHDWQGKVYVNGGDKRPLSLKLKMGGTVDRDMKVTLPIMVYERKEPDAPFFRARFRAQLGLMIPEIVRSAMDGELDWFWDAGIALDFFHYDIFNVSIYVGVQSLGGGLGLDITKNFGLYAGPHLSYQSLSVTAWLGPYFAF